MQYIENAVTEMGPTLSAATRMARRYGQIGIFEPDDIAQNAMLKVLNKKDEQVPTFGWLYHAVRSSAADAGRHLSRDRKIVYQLMCNVRVVAEQGAGYSCSGSRDREIDLMRLKNVLAKLSGPLKQVLVLYSEGYSYEEIARLTNTQLGTVRSRLHYARRRAKGLLSDHV